jgi:hypothetical protein
MPINGPIKDLSKLPPIMADLAKVYMFLQQSGREKARLVGVIVQTPTDEVNAVTFNLEALWNEDCVQEADRPEILRQLLQAHLQAVADR